MTFPEYISDSLVNNDLILMTSRQEMARLVSTVALQQHSDDLNFLSNNFDRYNGNEVDDNNWLTEVIQRTTSEIMTYLGSKYKVEDVYKNPVIREIATYMAVYKFTGRRGNEPLYRAEYIEGLDKLEKFVSGELYLDAATSGPRAYMLSYAVDNRFTQMPVRAIRQASSQLIPGQRQFHTWGFFYLLYFRCS
jgi:phage gp36-like protein